MTPTRFGIEAVKDPNFVFKLRDKNPRNCGLITVEKVESFIEERNKAMKHKPIKKKLNKVLSITIATSRSRKTFVTVKNDSSLGHEDRDIGVYLISCYASGRSYIGSSTNMRSRLATHKANLRRGSHARREMQKDFEKYGEGAFTFEAIVRFFEDTADGLHALRRGSDE